MLDKQTHVINHEMSHFVMYLYMGGGIQDLREMQVKQLSGFFQHRSCGVAENYFSHCCLALAGPVSDGLIGEMHTEFDISNANKRLRTGLSQKGFKGESLDEILDREYKLAWLLTEKVLIENERIIRRLVGEAASLTNASKTISKSKLQKLAKAVIAEWNACGYEFFWAPESFGLGVL